MKLLILTQKVDKNDPVLGFFHRWVEEFSRHYDLVTVIALGVGEYRLPANVRILSLGKEDGNSKLGYVLRFYKFIWQERGNYDAVFVHMNQEYVLLGWKLWKLLGKRIYLWRNHPHGDLRTRYAVWVSDAVFCTSPQSFTARFKKTKLMPVGIDTDFFKPDPSLERVPDSVLFLGRIAPIKKVLEFVEWFNALEEKFQATVAGSALPKDKDYERLVQSRASARIKFIGAVTQEEALKLYQTHEIYVNKTPSGSMDKTILEAAACETLPIVSNQDLKLSLENKKGKELRDFVIENHSIRELMNRLKDAII